jgi:hypothetical protein
MSVFQNYPSLNPDVVDKFSLFEEEGEPDSATRSSFRRCRIEPSVKNSLVTARILCIGYENVGAGLLINKIVGISKAPNRTTGKRSPKNPNNYYDSWLHSQMAHCL